MSLAKKPLGKITEYEYRKLAKKINRTYSGTKTLICHIRKVLHGKYLENKRLYGLVKAVMSETRNAYENEETVSGKESIELLAMQDIKRTIVESNNRVIEAVKGKKPFWKKFLGL